MTAARSVFALSFAAVLLLAGCSSAADQAGGDPEPTSGASPTATTPTGDAAGRAAPDPCSLVTVEEVEAVVGAEVIRTQGPDDMLQGRQCEWIVPHEEFGEDGVVLNVWVGPEFYAPDSPGAEVTGFEPVDDLGDVAHLWPRSALDLCGVIFMQDEVVLQINLTGSDEECLELARAASARL